MQLSAVLFDVDGTIAETEDLHRRSFNESFKEFNLDWFWDEAIYRELIRLYKEEKLSFKNVIAFNLDEYLPMDPKSKHSYYKFMYDNLIMGANMIELSRQHEIDKFVLLGTVCAYPKHTPVPFTEDELWNGYPEETNAPYGIAKKALMKLLETYKEQYDMNSACLIPVNMYGPHDHFNLTTSHVIPALILKFYNAMKNAERSVTLWGTGTVSREFLYAPDCCEAIALAIQKDVGPEPINIGTGKEITVADLAKEIAEQMGYEGEIIYDPSRPDGQPRRCLDTQRAKDRLGFEAKTDLQTGLKQTIEWFLVADEEGEDG